MPAPLTTTFLVAAAIVAGFSVVAACILLAVAVVNELAVAGAAATE
jgi:hypothetical protein